MHSQISQVGADMNGRACDDASPGLKPGASGAVAFFKFILQIAKIPVNTTESTIQGFATAWLSRSARVPFSGFHASGVTQFQHPHPANNVADPIDRLRVMLPTTYIFVKMT